MAYGDALQGDTRRSQRREVLCYMAPVMVKGPPDENYVRELAACVRAHGLPESYALHVESLAIRAK